MVLTANEIHGMSVKKKTQTANDAREEQLLILRKKKKYCSSHGELLDVRAALYLKDPEPQN